MAAVWSIFWLLCKQAIQVSTRTPEAKGCPLLDFAFPNEICLRGPAGYKCNWGVSERFSKATLTSIFLASSVNFEPCTLWSVRSALTRFVSTRNVTTKLLLTTSTMTYFRSLYLDQVLSCSKTPHIMDSGSIRTDQLFCFVGNAAMKHLFFVFEKKRDISVISVPNCYFIRFIGGDRTTLHAKDVSNRSEIVVGSVSAPQFNKVVHIYAWTTFGQTSTFANI